MKGNSVVSDKSDSKDIGKGDDTIENDFIKDKMKDRRQVDENNFFFNFCWTHVHLRGH